MKLIKCVPRQWLLYYVMPTNVPWIRQLEKEKKNKKKMSPNPSLTKNYNEYFNFSNS